MVEVGPQSFDQIFFLRPSQVGARRVLIVPDGKKTRNVLKGWVKIKTSECSATQIEDNNQDKNLSKIERDPKPHRNPTKRWCPE